MRFGLVLDQCQEFTGGLDSGQLPRPFRNAVALTRRLEIEHLWINLMCIIQDSLEDWDEKSRRVGDIYRGSFLNIVVNAFFTSHGSLPVSQARNPLLVAPVGLDLSQGLGNSCFQFFHMPTDWARYTQRL